jgi:hypothetical protein
MKKYFYTNGVDKIGPFTYEELKEQNLSKDTKVWFYGLDSWKPLSGVEELKSLTNSIPPPLRISKPINANNFNNTQNDLPEKTITPKYPKPKSKKGLKSYLVVVAVLFVIILIGYISKNNQADNKLYTSIASSAYETDVDFNFYVEKFYRDIGNYGIFPKKPQIQIIKFGKLDQLDNATNYHAISYGMNDDDRIEIYINPTTWDKFNKPMRYFLMYHELSHDVLNVDDLEDLPSNEGKLMYPALANYESKTMDDFIESSHALFEKVAEKQIKD